MPSNYTGDPDGAVETLSLMTGADRPTAQLFRVPLECLLNNDAAHIVRDQQQAARSALRLRPLMFGADLLATDDLAESMAATVKNPSAAIINGDPAVLIKVDSTGVFQAYDGPEVDQGGALASVTSLVRDAAASGDFIVAIGVGGNLNAYSANGGGAWSAGVAGIGGAVERIIYSPEGDIFITAGSGTGSVFRRTDPSASTWSSAASGFAAPFALAAFGADASSPGRVVCLGNSGDEPRFSTSDDDGATFAVEATTVPNPGDFAEAGDMQGAPFVTENIFHIARVTSGASIRLHVSPDGEAWTLRATLSASGFVFNSRPRLLMDQGTGLLVIVGPTDGGTDALYASVDEGVNWVGPCHVKAVGIFGYAVAGGRLFQTRNAMIYQSDGARI